MINKWKKNQMILHKDGYTEQYLREKQDANDTDMGNVQKYI